MIRLERINDEVFVAPERIVRFGDDEVAFVKRQALGNPRSRARICAHASNDNTLHEMLIAISAQSYIHPHRHVGKSESFHIVEGSVDVVIFDELGEIVDVVDLGGPGSGRNFFYRLSESAFHTLLIRSDILVLHEVTNGPFVKGSSITANFAPAEADAAKARDYIVQLSQRIAEFKRERST
jgi:cupin fold WbuC family metalloprotein